MAKKQDTKQGPKTTCPFCGTVFYPVNKSKICIACNILMEDYIKQIKTYMEDYPKLTAAELSAGADIPMYVIDYLIEDDFFYVTENNTMGFTVPARRCKKCNKPIQKGRYCEECLVAIVSSEVKSMDEVTKLKEEALEKTKENIRFHMAVQGRK